MFNIYSLSQIIKDLGVLIFFKIMNVIQKVALETIGGIVLMAIGGIGYKYYKKHKTSNQTSEKK